MRLLLLMLGISVSVVGIGTRAEAQNMVCVLQQRRRRRRDTCLLIGLIGPNPLEPRPSRRALSDFYLHPMARLSGFFVNFEPAGVGVLKHVRQIGDLVGRDRIEIGALSMISNSTLLNSCFSTVMLLTRTQRHGASNRN